MAFWSNSTVTDIAAEPSFLLPSIACCIQYLPDEPNISPHWWICSQSRLNHELGMVVNSLQVKEVEVGRYGGRVTLRTRMAETWYY
tara:strand:- start:229 stop:486 length:258 start_codon:yes stop_codon:yes gene_type:complete